MVTPSCATTALNPQQPQPKSPYLHPCICMPLVADTSYMTTVDTVRKCAVLDSYGAWASIALASASIESDVRGTRESKLSICRIFACPHPKSLSQSMTSFPAAFSFSCLLLARWIVDVRRSIVNFFVGCIWLVTDSFAYPVARLRSGFMLSKASTKG